MSYIQSIKQTSHKPVYSPRCSYSRYLDEIEKLTTHLAINIDKDVLELIKQEFEKNNNSLSRIEFVAICSRNLVSWQKDLSDRDNKLNKCVSILFSQIDKKNINKINYEEFNGVLIEKVLNLKSLRTQQAKSTALLRPSAWDPNSTKLSTPVQKIIFIKQLNKVAYFCEESNKIEFISTEAGSGIQKSLILNQQELIVETTIARRKKEGGKQNYKKDVVVANYKNIFLDMLYLNDAKYNMLITSSSDKTVRGWDLTSSVLTVAKQPQNQDEKMQHQFPAEIHCMAWDNINQVLYASGKSSKIYQWWIKTDSETELWDSNGHHEMISAMIMMPKLQFLATGDYNGKLILWDTIAQEKKFIYQEHTRSIITMAFHQGLILLFTAAYDHSICVWNPYIPSLIHKISNNANVIQLDIMPQSNLLIALDSNGIARIREVNKFSLVSQFPIEKIEDNFRIEATTMTAAQDPLKYFFAGNFISCFQYVKMDATNGLDLVPLCLHYLPSKFKLVTPIKNYVVVWDVLTGKVHSVFKNQAEAEITAYDICHQLGISLVGDAEGHLQLRKLQNGLLFKKLYQFKTSVSLAIIRDGGIWCDKVVFGVSSDGEILAFGKENNNDFVLMRSLNLKKTQNAGTITCIDYQQKRNTLILGTNIGQIIFLDVDKNRVINICQTGLGQIQSITQIQDIPLLLSFSRKGQIFGIYLPPHIKKFKPSCKLTSESLSRVTSTVMSKVNSSCFIGYQTGVIQCFTLHVELLTESTSDSGLAKIKSNWKCSLGESIKDMFLMDKENTIFAISGEKGIFLIKSQNGVILSRLKQDLSMPQELVPLFYFKQQSNEAYFNKKYYPIDVKTTNHDQIIRKNHDPFYYIDIAERNRIKVGQYSNPKWNFHPDLREEVQINITKITSLRDQLLNFGKKPKNRNQSSSFDIYKAIELHKRWQKQKDEEDEVRNTKIYQRNQKSRGSLQRKTKFQSLHQSKLIMKHKISNTSGQDNTAMHRLGLALQSIDENDEKALKFIQMAHKRTYKSATKLPRIQ